MGDNHAWDKKNPWLRSYYGARRRCTNPNDPRFSRYGGRGIKFSLTLEEIKSLWVRDQAEKMKWPTIDRIDNDGDYCFENCRFLEQSENSSKGMVDFWAKNRKDRCARGHLKTAENFKVYLDRNGKSRSYCRKCQSIVDTRRRQAMVLARGGILRPKRPEGRCVNGHDTSKPGALMSTIHHRTRKPQKLCRACKKEYDRKKRLNNKLKEVAALLTEPKNG